MKTLTTSLALCALLGAGGAAQAALIDRGSGLIYDNDINLTWLADANYAQTSGYDADGLMNWDAATAWAAGLVYGGYSDWRLPATPQPDATCDNQIGGIISYGYNCSGSEMGHLFYQELGGTEALPILTSADPDLALFQNIQDTVYWSGTEYAENTTKAWSFSTYVGNQRQDYKDFQGGELFAWAVRTGDVAAAGGSVPEPATLMLLGVGLAGLGWARRRRAFGA